MISPFPRKNPKKNSLTQHSDSYSIFHAFSFIPCCTLKTCRCTRWCCRTTRSTPGFPASPASSPGSTSTSGETLLSTPPPPSRPSHLIDLEKSSNISCSYICGKFTAHLQVIVLIYIVILCTLLKPYVTSQKKLICLCGSPIHVFSGGSV